MNRQQRRSKKPVHTQVPGFQSSLLSNLLFRGVYHEMKRRGMIPDNVTPATAAAVAIERQA